MTAPLQLMNLLLPVAGIVLVGVVMALVERRHTRTLATLHQSLTIQAGQLGGLERDLAALLSCSRRIGERVGHNERSQRTMQKQIDHLHAHDDNQVAVQHAMKLLTSGLDLKNVTSICDLTEGEVEILQNLARHQQAA